MNIHNAILHVQQYGCACKYINQLLDKLTRILETGLTPVQIILGQHAVIMDTGDTQEVLCSRFLEQRD